MHTFVDLFYLSRYEDEITKMEGFGDKSYQNLITATMNARTTTLPRVIYGLGITGIGLANAKMLCREFAYDVDNMIDADIKQLSEIDGIGEVLASAFYSYFHVEENRTLLYDILKELTIEKEEIDYSNEQINGKSFVVTGSLMHFENRDELKAKIESLGGKVTGSVTNKTTALINNDIASNSSKNKKAKELGILIVTEEQFMDEYLQ